MIAKHASAPIATDLLSWASLPVLATDRLLLRWMDRPDLEALLEIFSDAEVMRYWPSNGLANMADARKFLREIHQGFYARSFFQWGIARAEDNRLIGSVVLFSVDQRNRRAEVGYLLGRPFWGHGYMYEALGALCAFVFEQLGFQRLEADVDPRNVASINLLERMGFNEEGYLRQRWLARGEVQDSMIFGLLAREWRGGFAYTMKTGAPPGRRIGLRAKWIRPLALIVQRAFL